MYFYSILYKLNFQLWQKIYINIIFLFKKIEITIKTALPVKVIILKIYYKLIFNIYKIHYYIFNSFFVNEIGFNALIRFQL